MRGGNCKQQKGKSAAEVYTLHHSQGRPGSLSTDWVTRTLEANLPAWASVCALSHEPGWEGYVSCSWASKDHCNHLPGKPACPSQTLLKLVSLFLTQNKWLILVITGECAPPWNWQPRYLQIIANLSRVMKWQVYFVMPDLRVWAVTNAAKGMFP